MSSSEFNRNESYEKYVEHFEQQRQELNLKIDKLSRENLEKEKTIANLTHQSERSGDALQRKISELEQAKASIENDKKTLQQKFDQTKQRLTEMQDEAMQNKLEYGREQALLTQKIEFLNRKIDEQQQNHEDLQRAFDEKLSKYRNLKWLTVCCRALEDGNPRRLLGSSRADFLGKGVVGEKVRAKAQTFEGNRGFSGEEKPRPSEASFAFDGSE